MAKEGRIISLSNFLKSVSYADLIGSNQFNIELGVEKTWNAPALTTDVRLKATNERTLIGKSIPRVDTHDKVYGNF